MDVEKEYIKNVDKLVPCPEIALEVLNIAHQEDCNISQLSKKIEQDPNLTANMLHLANSAYFGHMKKINSITDIIVRLGLESVKLIAITSASVGMLKSPQAAYNLQPGAMWYHSYATAILASIIGRYAKVKDISSLYTSALLHDIGKLILNRPLQIEIMNRSEPENVANIIELERIYLHTDHARVGQLLLEQWDLPLKISVPVGFHHSSLEARNHKMPCQIVHLANSLVESMGIVSSDLSNILFNPDYFSENEDTLPDIPDFKDNMEKIIDEFYEKLNEASTIDFVT